MFQNASPYSDFNSDPIFCSSVLARSNAGMVERDLIYPHSLTSTLWLNLVPLGSLTRLQVGRGAPFPSTTSHPSSGDRIIRSLSAPPRTNLFTVLELIAVSLLAYVPITFPSYLPTISPSLNLLQHPHSLLAPKQSYLKLCLLHLHCNLYIF